LRPELISPSDARALFAPFLQEASLLLPTAAEACLLTGYEDEEDAARALLAHGAELVALKLGAAGALFCTSEEIVRAPGFDVMEVDPTGAGDCFNAACVLGLQQEWPLRQLAQFATAAGALAVTHQGPMEGAPARTDIETLLSERTTRNGG
jgi:sugar/nucleoside kinase (ribokinase family)